MDNELWTINYGQSHQQKSQSKVVMRIHNEARTRQRYNASTNTVIMFTRQIRFTIKMTINLRRYQPESS